MKRLNVLIGAGLVAAGTAALAQTPPQPSPEQMQQMMKALGQLGAAMAASTNAAPLVSHKDLKALLPAELPGLARKGSEAETGGGMGVRISRAQANYRDDKGAEITIEMSDLGGIGGLGAMAAAGFAMAEIDKETDEGYERTFDYKGHKAKEEYDNQDKSGSIEMIVRQRFSVKIHGSGVKAEAIKGALEKIDLAKLAELKPAPAAAPQK